MATSEEDAESKLLAYFEYLQETKPFLFTEGVPSDVIINHVQAVIV